MLNQVAYIAISNMSDRGHINITILDRLTSMGFYYYRQTDNDSRVLLDMVLEEMYVENE